MAAHGFTRNHRDHSNDHGYQFEFFCDKCGSGFRSSFKTSTLGLAASVIKAAGAFLGGSLYRAGWGADQLKDAFRGPAWDAAFKEAIDECRPRFHQCTLCGGWFCPQVCWNTERGLCEGCAPNLAEHAPALQASTAVEQARQKVAQVDQTRGVDVAEAAAAIRTCSQCQGSLAAGARFCAQCGGAVAVAGPRFCTGCGGSLAAGSRFCSGCGAAAPAS
jgi:hypothetical protein